MSNLYVGRKLMGASWKPLKMDPVDRQTNQSLFLNWFQIALQFSDHFLKRLLLKNIVETSVYLHVILNIHAKSMFEKHQSHQQHGNISNIVTQQHSREHRKLHRSTTIRSLVPDLIIRPRSSDHLTILHLLYELVMLQQVLHPRARVLFQDRLYSIPVFI